jgi:hypothetical protein
MRVVYFLTGEAYQVGNSVRENLIILFRFILFVPAEGRIHGRTDMFTERTVNAASMSKTVSVISKKDVGVTSVELH